MTARQADALKSGRPIGGDYDQRRGNSAARGYDARWRKYRRAFLLEHPWCVVPGCGRPATDVDHIKRIAGPDDPLFWDGANHQALCHQHHAAKTAVDVRGAIVRR